MPPSAIDPRVPRDLETIVLKALAKRPADRYSTAAELAEDLARFSTTNRSRPGGSARSGRLWRVARRHPGITSVTTVAAAAILAIATFAYVRVVAERDEARRCQRQDRTSPRSGQGRQSQGTYSEKRSARQDDRGRGSIGQLPIAASRSRLDSRDRRDSSPRPNFDPSSAMRLSSFWCFERSRPTSLSCPRARHHGLVFGPTGHRLAVLSEDDEELSFWDVERRQPPEHVASAHRGRGRPCPRRCIGERKPECRQDRNPARVSGPDQERIGIRPARRNKPRPAGRRSNWFVQRVAQSGQSIAALLPDERGVALIDLDPFPEHRTAFSIPPITRC